MIRFAAALQGNFAGAIGWYGVNLFFAPYLTALSYREMKQLSQTLIYEFSQQAVGRGGQTMFTDIHLYWEVPKYLKNVPAIGPGGDYTGKTYDEYAEDARRFARAIFEVFREGDAAQRPFVFPRPLVHITDEFWHTPNHEDFLNLICDVAAEKGNTLFVFDRGDSVNFSECCRINPATDKEASDDMKSPWNMRYCALQNVSINLPRLGYRAGGDDDRLFSLISETLSLVAQAHMEKKMFIERLMSLGGNGPLSLLTMKKGGFPYLRMKRAKYLTGMVGLNELVKIHKGHELHESAEARTFALQVIKYMKDVTDRLSRGKGIRFVLQQTPAESTPYRFARLDLKHHSPQSGRFVKGDIAKGEIYYTNSTNLPVSADISPIERVAIEGTFHPFIEGETISSLWLGDIRPSSESLAQFIRNVFEATQNRQIVFSPAFTTCFNCNRTTRGLKDHCEHCLSRDIDGITMISGYYSRISDWNKGKLAELRDRKRSFTSF
jgi:ribonucleoside-triphosphate reductase